MPFHSLLFLCTFLPLFLVGYWAAPRVAKNGVVLVASLLFYLWGAPTFLPVVLALGVVDFGLGHLLQRVERAGARRAILGAGVTMHLGVLAWFKYANFFVHEAGELLISLGLADAPIPWVAVVLPIGVSFLTFEEISYLVDVYRRDARPPRSPFQYLLFLMLFPHSIAGPIFRWKDLEAQLRERTVTADGVREGIERFCLGLAKKVLVADAVAIPAEAVFAMQPGALTTGWAWLGTIAYALQIYFDFSGYSDMAIGLGRMFGFRFKENFLGPYGSASVTEFWTRWHVSLSSWLRDYLYIPIGGGRVAPWRVNLNVLLVFVLSGFWHGASWTFLAWGLFHGLCVLAEKLPPVRALKTKLPWQLNVVGTFVLVSIGWVLFRAESLPSAARILQALAGLPQLGDAPAALPGEVLPYRSLVIGLGALAALSLPLLRGRTGTAFVWPVPMRAGFGLALLVLSLAAITNSKFSPLIYFQF